MKCDPPMVTRTDKWEAEVGACETRPRVSDTEELSRAGQQRKQSRAKGRRGERRRRKRRCRKPRKSGPEVPRLESLEALSLSKPWAREVEEDNSGEMSLDHAPSSPV